MSDPAILAAVRKKATIADRISKSEARIKGFKAQVAEIDAFISQWEKYSGTPAPTLNEAAVSQNDTDSDVDEAPGNSSKEEVAQGAKLFLVTAQSPMSRADLYEKLVGIGLRIQGKVPEMVLSTMLWRAGADHDIVRLKSGGYWLKDRPLPPKIEGAQDVFD